MAPIDRDQLFVRFSALCARLGLRKPQPVFDELFESYTGPDRHYHDIAHIAASLRELDGVRELARDPDAIELAIWFHDCVYDATRVDNEEQSAQIARQALAEMGARPRLIDTVCELIMATQHTKPPATEDEELLTDIDLAPLGASDETFETNGQLIRREYGHLDEQTYARGRSAILRGFLSRPRIFYTENFARRLERQARANLTRATSGNHSAATP
jgi:predicted metal-dependent HD superfamily phosphohydrolase